MKIITAYIATDGKMFHTEEECLKHESSVEVSLYKLLQKNTKDIEECYKQIQFIKSKARSTVCLKYSFKGLLNSTKEFMSLYSNGIKTIDDMNELKKRLEKMVYWKWNYNDALNKLAAKRKTLGKLKHERHIIKTSKTIEECNNRMNEVKQ